MRTKTMWVLLVILVQILIVSALYQRDQNEQPRAGYCKVDTTCRIPKMDEYKYNGVIRSGYLAVPEKNGSSLAFMFFGRVGASEAEVKNFPTTIILGGGPGASSMINNMREVGPLLLKKIFSITVEENKYTWARDSNLLFVDQPIGTGVSCLATNTSIPNNSSAIALDFYRAFSQLFTDKGCFGQGYLNFPMNTPFFLFGEGYGGKFATAIASKFLDEKQRGGPITGLRGVGIGGGFNNPMKILMEMGNYGFSLGLLDFQERVRMEKMALRAHFNSKINDWGKVKSDFENSLQYLYERSGVGYYDVTKDGFDEGTSSVISDLVQYFFSDKNNLDKFGFETSIIFESASKQVYYTINADFMKSEVPNMEYLLNSGVPILIYQGQDDGYTNPTGTLRWLEEINYPSSQEFISKILVPWTVNGVMFGTWKSAGKLTVAVVHSAGHYTPKDSPQGMYYLFRDWIKSNQ